MSPNPVLTPSLLALARIEPGQAYDEIEANGGMTTEQAAVLYAYPPLPEICPACKGDGGFQANSTWVPCEVCDGDGTTNGPSYAPEWLANYVRRDDSLAGLLCEYVRRDARFGEQVVAEMMKWRLRKPIGMSDDDPNRWCVSCDEVNCWCDEFSPHGRQCEGESEAHFALKRARLACLTVPCGKCGGSSRMVDYGSFLTRLGSDEHLYKDHQIVKCPHCPGSGRVEIPVACPECRGSGSVSLRSGVRTYAGKCTLCGGEGKVPVSRLVRE